MYNDGDYDYEGAGYYEDEGAGYSFNHDSSLMDLCVLPVFVQVTVVFTKVFGLTALVMIFLCPVFKTAVIFNVFKPVSSFKARFLSYWTTETTSFCLDGILGIICAALFYDSMTFYLGTFPVPRIYYIFQFQVSLAKLIE